MRNGFKKLMREQVQEGLSPFMMLAKRTTPKRGWIKTIREALGMSAEVLSRRLGCSRANVTAIEKREQKGTLNLETLNEVAEAMNCKLVYCLVPLKSFDEILEQQARQVAKKRIEIINHSMKLEAQGLTPKQLQRQENELVRELLQGNPKNLWDDKRNYKKLLAFARS